MLFSVEQAFVGRAEKRAPLKTPGEKRAPLKTPAWEVNSDLAKVGSNHLRSPSIRPPFLTLQVPKVNSEKDLRINDIITKEKIS